jgi:tRNA dimethylallyltransferase
MDLGTGKDLAEYNRGGAAVPFHLIDILEPCEEFSVFDYQEHFYRCFEKIGIKGKSPIMVGGSGLYLDSIIRGYRMQAVPENRELRAGFERETMGTLRRRFLSLGAETHNSTDLMERKRLIRAIEIAEYARNHPGESGPPVMISPFVIGIRCERAELRRNITARLRSRLAEGMIDEVSRLHQNGTAWERIDSFGLEYRYAGLYLRGEIDYEKMFEILNTRIHQFAKRQETWFRRMERKGVRIHWINGADEKTAFAVIGNAVI